ncbi:hypothetical protein U3A58_07400 [Algoriphagus sp. C2-6-M1]|uniref:hypothetical protein n=1 Tax=Algoriphagus persicinus TaxID=3108754 RepID=UPI002B3B3413|nr:hypothetical protein [Algoriphagus sp. C2-6-M1]MEB2780215.1 hypothetical protein [Algoriphagus sp. C2-6-M1]
MSYMDWPSKKERLGALFLDPKNPRLPKRSDPYLQNEIIEELVNHSNVKEIASSISEDGYSPLEQMIAHQNEADGKKYVLEGNRRLTACKLLRNPNLAPEEHQAYFKKLAKKVDPNEISKLQVLFAPDRDSALKMIVRKHTKKTVKEWEPIMKAHFYVQPLEDGLTVKEAAERLGVTEGDIKDARYLLQLYEAAKKIELEDEVKKIVHNEYTFSLSTFDRVVSKPSGKTFLGVQQDTEGNIVVDIESSEFKKGLKRIVTDIATSKETSRTLNKVEDIDKYFGERIGNDDRPNLSKKKEGQSIADIFEKEEIVDEPEEQTPSPLPKPTPLTRKPTGLFFKSSLNCELDNQKIKDIIIELTTLSPRKYPNSSAMIIRMLLELSTYEYLDSIGELQVWRGELEAKGKPKKELKEWMPQMSEMLNRIMVKKLLDDPAMLRNLGLIMREDSTKPILRSMNQFVHNSKWHPNEEKLRNIWKDIEPYLKKILLKSVKEDES